MDQIEKALHTHFAESEAEEERLKAAPSAASSTTALQASSGDGSASNAGVRTNGNGNGTTIATQTQPAFAIVNTVAPDSPAETAGLKAGDRVLQFGDANWRNHEKLAKVAQIVGRSEGRRIEVVVARGEEVLTLGLVPRRDWGGRGTLGCHLKEA